jgi:hypothetical protein
MKMGSSAYIRPVTRLMDVYKYLSSESTREMPSRTLSRIRQVYVADLFNPCTIL